MPYVFCGKPCVFFGVPKNFSEVGDLLQEEVKLLPGMQYVFSGCLSVLTGKRECFPRVRN